MSAQTGGAAGSLRPSALVAAYLGQYELRMEKRSSGLVFARGAPDAQVALLYASVLEGTSDPVARAVLLRGIRRQADRGVLSLRLDSTSALRGAALARAATASGDEHAAAAAAGLLQLPLPRRWTSESAAWSVAFAARCAQLVEGSLRARALAVVAAASEVLEARSGRADGAVPPATLAAVAQALQVADLPLWRDELRKTLPGLLPDPGSTPTRDVACLLFTAAAADLPEVRERLLSELLGRAIDGTALVSAASDAQSVVLRPWVPLVRRAMAVESAAGSLLVRGIGERVIGRFGAEGTVAAPPSDDRLPSELSPWVPAGLWACDPEPAPVDQRLNPAVVPLPRFALRSGPGAPDRLDLTVVEEGVTSERPFTAADADVLFERAVAQLEARDVATRSARQHGHLAIALMAVSDRCLPGSSARERVGVLLERSLQGILDGQKPHGGWSYGRTQVKSVTYSAEGRSETQFPDRDYSIDAAVPGIALCLGFARGGDPEHLDAAARAFAYFEQSVGRVPWQGRAVWKLWPGDPKTRFMGTAVNYELWNATFFAAFARLTPDATAAARARGYVDNAVEYATYHTDAHGNIAYGDYVREHRTAYASWDAMLLAAIGSAAGDQRALDLSRRIVERLAEVMEPSGAMPNVTSPIEDLGDVLRPSVHRHGLGPHPVRSYYQSYFTIAAALAQRAPEAARRAWGFVLVHLYDPVWPSLSTGTDGDGRPAPGSTTIAAPDWVLLSLAMLPEVSAMRLELGGRPVSTPPDRLVRVVVELLEATGAERGGSCTSRGLAAATLARLDPVWGEEAVRCARETLQEPAARAGDEVVALWCAAHGLTGEASWLRAATARFEEREDPEDLAALAARLHAATALTRVGVAAGHAERLALRLAGVLDPSGWAPGAGPSAGGAQSSVLAALVEAGEVLDGEARQQVRNAARLGGRSMQQGWMGVPGGHQSGLVRLAAEDLVRTVWVLSRTSRPEEVRFVRHAFLRLMHAHRSASGLLSDRPGATGEVPATARALPWLARLAAERPTWLR